MACSMHRRNDPSVQSKRTNERERESAAAPPKTSRLLSKRASESLIFGNNIGRRGIRSPPSFLLKWEKWEPPTNPPPLPSQPTKTALYAIAVIALSAPLSVDVVSPFFDALLSSDLQTSPPQPPLTFKRGACPNARNVSGMSSVSSDEGSLSK